MLGIVTIMSFSLVVCADKAADSVVRQPLTDDIFELVRVRYISTVDNNLAKKLAIVCYRCKYPFGVTSNAFVVLTKVAAKHNIDIKEVARALLHHPDPRIRQSAANVLDSLGVGRQ